MAHIGKIIGAFLPLRRKSPCVRLNMLKLAPKTEYGQKTAPFSEVLFSVQTAVRPGNKPASANQVRAYSLLLSNDHHIWIGGPQTLKKLKLPQPKRKDADRTPQHHFSAAKLAYMAFLSRPSLQPMFGLKPKRSCRMSTRRSSPFPPLRPL